MSNSSDYPHAPLSNWMDLLDLRANELADCTAFVFLDEEGQQSDTLTYHALHQRARAFAHRLTSEVSAGDRALLLHPPGLEYVVAFYGCLYAGVIAVPLFPPERNRAEHVDVVARDCAASAVVTSANVAAGMDSLSDDLFIKGLPRIVESAAVKAGEAVADEAKQTAYPEFQVTDIAYLQYTSGSTSTPKGVIIDHTMALHQCAELVYGWGVDSTSVVVSWLPHFHDFGQVSSVLMPVFTGTKAVLMAPATFVKSPIRWLAAVSEYRGTHSGSPNFAFDLCVDKTTPEQRAGLDLSSWRLVSNGAEPVRKATLDRFRSTFIPHGLPRTALTPGYGLAEATLKVTSGSSGVAFTSAHFDETALGLRRVEPATGPASTELVGCGWAVMDTEIAIVAPESGERLPADTVGEIWVSGPIVSPGYWGRPEESEQTFRATIAGADDGKTYLRTGDLGFLRDEELFICGRVKNLMIVNGVNYYLEDIEATVVVSDDSLRAGAVIAFAVDRDGQENLVLVAEHRADASPAQLVTVVHDAVARKHALAPSVIVFISQGTIPRTTSGKMRRQQCKADFLAGRLSEVHRWEGLVTITETSTAHDNSGAPGMPSMRELVQQGLLTQVHEWIAQHMGSDVAQVDTGRSLVEHGLGSVDQMNLHDHLETWSGKRFPPELMWDAETIDDMTGRIADHLVPNPTAAPLETPVTDPTGVGAQ
ncbi:fatty acyl-AMP ligase [Nocardia sp. NPDC046473]|uniref:fatty acyl-AMP ligase n=1 Tax=Nocardia sp. NPDC046473 TaxID=3155733 RepID=UPI0033DD699D